MANTHNRADPLPEECCAVMVGEGCTTTGGTYVILRNGDGTFSYIDPATGNAVPEAERAAECPRPAEHTVVTTLTGAAPGVLIVDGTDPSVGTILSWSVRCISEGITLEIAGSGFAATTMQAGELIESAAQDGQRLDDLITITADASGVARVSYTWMMP